MIFGAIKGYNIVAMSRRKAKQGNFGITMNSVIQEKDLQEEILVALADGGQVYALYKKKEMVACYIWVKEPVNIAEYTDTEEKEESVKIDEENHLAFVLKKAYMADLSEEVREQFEKAVLEEVKESTVYQDVKYIAWRDKLLIPRKIKLGKWEIVGGIGMGIALGMLFGIAMDNLGLGMALGVAFGYMFATTFRTLYRTGKKNE